MTQFVTLNSFANKVQKTRFSSKEIRPKSSEEDNILAILSQYVHGNISIDDPKYENDIKTAINSKALSNFLTNNFVIKELNNKEQLIKNMPEFYEVPFPNPKKSDFTYIDLFAGIGGIRLPFQELGYKCVFSSEWDGNAKKTYMANFGEMPFGDITKEKVKHFIPQHFNVLLAGFPCQSFSIIGKMKGFEDTRGTMFYEIASILEKHQPDAILLENVKQLTTHNNGETFKTILRILSELGYYTKWKVLNALDFGLPQKRERVIIVGFLDSKKCDSFDFSFEKVPYNLSSILEKDENVDPSLFASQRICEKRKKKTEGKNIFYPSIWHENKAGNISICNYACALRTGASYNYLLVNGIRRPSSRELLRLQGFPDNFKIAVSHSEIRRQTGNSVAVPMIRMVAKKIDNILRKQ